MNLSHHALLYALGFLIIIGGAAYAAYLLGVAPVWIVAGSLVALTVGVVTAATHPPAGHHPL